MAASAPAVERANGLSTVFDVITSPVKAYETLRAVPMWGWAYVVAVVLSMAGQYISTPVVIHVIQNSWPAQVAANPQLAAMTPERQQAALGFAVAAVKYVWLFMPIMILIAALLQTVIMLIFKAAGRGNATFKQLWCAAMNTMVVSMGIYSLVNGIITMLRGAQSFATTSDVVRVIPSLAWFAGGASPKLIAFLAAFNIISIWGAVLLAIAMIRVARVSRANATGCAVVTTALAGLYFAFGAR